MIRLTSRRSASPYAPYDLTRRRRDAKAQREQATEVFASPRLCALYVFKAQETSSTVLDSSFVDVQGSQAVTLFPVVQACKLVAGESRFSFALDAVREGAGTGLIEDVGDALANLWQRNGRGRIFFPVGFRSPGTRWRGVRAFDDGASHSNDEPRSRPGRLRSCSAGDIPRCDVRPWRRARIRSAASGRGRWTDSSRS